MNLEPMKKCPDCGAEKPKSAFGRTSKRCRECAVTRRKRLEKEVKARFFERHPDYQYEQNKKFYAKNREREKARAKEWRDENKERVKVTNTAWREANKEHFLAKKKKWREENEEYLIEYRREYHLRNQEENNERSRNYKEAHKEELALKSAEYWRQHPEINRANRAKRRAAEKRATPAWADQDKIMAFYVEAVRLTRQTGIKHHVDHIYPLQSKLVCGLHVETNLQVVPETENHSKKNRMPIGPGDIEQPRCCAWPSIVYFEATRGRAPVETRI
jgi:hypothetical protein